MSTGIAKTGKVFAVCRKDGRLSTYFFRSRYRAAEHVMRAAKCEWWPELAKRGIRIVAVE